MRCLAVALLFVVYGSGCSSADGKSGSGQLSDAQRYEEAMQKLLRGDYVTAAQKFDALSAGTMNPVLVQLATLRSGDALFLQGNHAEAAEVYREYLVQFPASSDAPHALYMRGLCYLEKMPEDHFILPPAESREMDDAMNAHANFAAVVDQHPHSLYALRARPMLIRTVERRCRQHLYVARYYEKTGKPMGVIQRIRQALRLEEKERASRHVPDSFQCAATPGTLLSLARAYQETRDMEGLLYTRDVCRQLQQRIPQSGETLKELDRMVQDLESGQTAAPR